MGTFTHINYLALAVAVVSYFAIGAVWFSVLFGKQWIALTNVQMGEDDKKNLGKMFATTFLINAVICIAIGYMVLLIQPEDTIAAAKLGLALGVGFMAAPCTMNYMYAKRPIKLTMIDAGYHVLAIIVATVILGTWK